MLRLFGIFGVFSFAVFSWVYSVIIVQPTTGSGAGASRTPNEVATDSELGSLPKYLALGPSWVSANYRVGESADPQMRDIDVDMPQTEKQSKESGRPLLETLETIPPGLYATEFGAKDCSYELTAVMADKVERVIGQDSVTKGRVLVTIDDLEPDRFVAAAECGDWYEWVPIGQPLTVAGDGDYMLADLSPGLWQVPKGCVWEKVVAFRGARAADIVTSAAGPTPLEIAEADSDEVAGVRLRGCTTPMRFTAGE